jgi:hypothetical protein
VHIIVVRRQRAAAAGRAGILLLPGNEALKAHALRSDFLRRRRLMPRWPPVPGFERDWQYGIGADGLILYRRRGRSARLRL